MTREIDLVFHPPTPQPPMAQGDLPAVRTTGFLLGILAGVGALHSLHRPTPPLIDGVRPSASGAAYDCEEDLVPAGNSTFAQSKTIDRRLLKYFPLGTPSARLRMFLVHQGFHLQGHCSADRTIGWARLRTEAGGIATVFWRKDLQGRLRWEFGRLEGIT